MKKRLLQDLMPDVADELCELLLEEGSPILSEQVASLAIIDRCRCGDDFCASFYTMPKLEGSWGPDHENVALNPTSGEFILDVVDGKIAFVEVLFRDDIRDRLRAVFP